MPSQLNRRDALALLGLSTLSLALPTSAMGFTVNETLRIGLIGCGGRMNGALLKGLYLNPNIEVVAVCDVDDAALVDVQKVLAQHDCKPIVTKDHHALLERSDIDAVMVATPDHWHVPITIDALQAGKHVYVEKPVSHNIEEGQQLIDVKRQHPDIAVQVGAQQRNMPHIQVLKQKLVSGEINPGPIHRVHMQWHRNQHGFRYVIPKTDPAGVDWKRFLGNAPMQPFDAYKMNNWRWFWDFGNGMLGDLMVHWMDATNYLLDLPLPQTVVAMGGNYIAGDKQEAPDVMQAMMDYPDEKLQADFSYSISNNDRKACTIIMGQDATIYFDRGRYEVIEQKNNNQNEGTILDSMIAGQGPKGMDFYHDYNGEALHIADWLAAIKDRRQPLDNVEEAVKAANVAHYGNLSFKQHRIMTTA